MLKRWWIASTALLLIVGLAGLAVGYRGQTSSPGSQDPDQAAPPATDAASPSATPAPGTPCDGKIDHSEGVVELTVTVSQEKPAYIDAVAQFNQGRGKDLGIVVELLDLGEIDYESFIDQAGPTDSFPDILDMDGPFLYNFAWNDYIQPLGNCVSTTDLDDFLPSIISQGTYNGELYSLGSFDSGMGLWAKKSVLESVGARIPTSHADAWTAAEFTQILSDLSDSGISAPLDIKWHYGAGEWPSYGFAPIIQSAGGDLVDRSSLQTASGTLNSPEAVASMTTLQDWVKAGYVDLEASDDTNFTEGDAAISWVGHWLYQAYSDSLGEDLILLPLPDFGQGSVSGMGSWNWAMSANTPEPDAAWAFMEFLTSPEQVDNIATLEGAVPSRKSVLDANPSFQVGGDRYLYRAGLEAAPQIARPRPATPAYGVIRDSFSTAFQDIINGQDVATALDGAATTIDEDLTANDGYAQP